MLHENPIGFSHDNSRQSGNLSTTSMDSGIAGLPATLIHFSPLSVQLSSVYNFVDFRAAPDSLITSKRIHLHFTKCSAMMYFPVNEFFV